MNETESDRRGAGEPSAPAGAATLPVVVAVVAGVVILRFLLGSS